MSFLDSHRVKKCAQEVLKNTTFPYMQETIRMMEANIEIAESWKSDGIYDYHVFRYLADSKYEYVEAVSLNSIFGERLYCFVVPDNMETFWIQIFDEGEDIKVAPCYLNRNREFVCVNTIQEAIEWQSRNSRY